MNWQKSAKKILGEKISLEIVTQNDAEKLLELRTNAIVNKFIGRDTNQTVRDIEWFIEKMNSAENKSLFFIIKSKQNEFLGTICLWRINEALKCAEVGYELLPEYFGKGIMNEALQTIISLAFNELGFEYLKAFTHRDNENSRKLLEKNRFIFQKDKKDHKLYNVVYELKSNAL